MARSPLKLPVELFTPAQDSPNWTNASKDLTENVVLGTSVSRCFCVVLPNADNCTGKLGSVTSYVRKLMLPLVLEIATRVLLTFPPASVLCRTPTSTSCNGCLV